MRLKLVIPALACISFVCSWAQTAPSIAAGLDDAKIALSVPSGAPMRLYLTRKVAKRQGAPVEAKLLEPMYAFDREVVPAGTVIRGEVARVHPVSKWQRTRAIVNGDFTPLRTAEVEFTSLILPDGRSLSTHTVGTVGLTSIYTEPAKKKKDQKAQPQSQNGGILGTAKQTAKDRARGEINARTRGVYDLVRGPNKKEKFIDFLWSKAPYHPQYVRRGTRFDAPLRDPLEFGMATLKADDLGVLGSQPIADSVVHVRLMTALDSASAKAGESVEALVTTPLFSAEHKLVFPEGTRLVGTVVVAKKARSFHRPGQLRFNFQKIELPPQVEGMRPEGARPDALKTVATLAAAESGGTTPIEVDGEGGVQAKESKSRFLAPAISLVLASRAADNDAGRHHQTGTGGDANISGRTLGGGLGLGMLGSAVAQSSRYVGMAFGYYGLAWSVYTNVIARGAEVQFQKDAMMDIKFGARTPAPGAKFRGVETGGGQYGR